MNPEGIPIPDLPLKGVGESTMSMPSQGLALGLTLIAAPQFGESSRTAATPDEKPRSLRHGRKIYHKPIPPHLYLKTRNISAR